LRMFPLRRAASALRKAAAIRCFSITEEDSAGGSESR